MSETMDFRACVNAIESTYEFMLAYAAQGRDKEGPEARTYIEALSNALGAIGDAATAEIVGKGAANADALENYVSVLADDARWAKAAVDVTLSVPSIGSQLIDNLNASIHLRALLTSIFLIDEALRVS